jgi:aspartokinase
MGLPLDAVRRVITAAAELGDEAITVRYECANSSSGESVVSVTVSDSTARRLRSDLAGCGRDTGDPASLLMASLARLSVVRAGIGRELSQAAGLIEVLRKMDIPVLDVEVALDRLSVLCAGGNAQQALVALHHEFVIAGMDCTDELWPSIYIARGKDQRRRRRVCLAQKVR